MKRKVTLGSLMFLFWTLVQLCDTIFFKILFCSEMIFLFVFSRIFKKSYNANYRYFQDVDSEKICAYLINLDRAGERLNFVLPSIIALGFPVKRISAIDGKFLSQKEIESVTDVESYKKFFKMLPEVGTIGCSLSHEKAWLAFLESDNEFAIIFEDDVQFDPEKLKRTVKSVIEKKDLWDIASFEIKHRGCPMKICSLDQQKSLVFYLTNVTHAGCYLINRRAAEELLKKFYPIKMPVDHYFSSTWEFDLKFVGIEPRMVFQKFGDSYIKNSSCTNVRTPITLAVNVIYQIQRAILYFIYNFLCLYFNKRNM
ncbi:MAG: glycosyltransferase family 25 protein [Holosporaceae bacterium]|jgi:GR25 family glycosyltransferase involved in LPS biosynthesis|nr:glycosyltransferase family 25 protein [Holosporaceae bacterium]